MSWLAIDCAEGVFTYVGVREDGSAIWRWHSRDEHGNPTIPGRPPKRFRGTVNKSKRKPKKK